MRQGPGFTETKPFLGCIRRGRPDAPGFEEESCDSSSLAAEKSAGHSRLQSHVLGSRWVLPSVCFSRELERTQSRTQGRSVGTIRETLQSSSEASKRKNDSPHSHFVSCQCTQCVSLHFRDHCISPEPSDFLFSVNLSSNPQWVLFSLHRQTKTS